MSTNEEESYEMVEVSFRFNFDRYIPNVGYGLYGSLGTIGLTRNGVNFPHTMLPKILQKIERHEEVSALFDDYLFFYGHIEELSIDYGDCEVVRIKMQKH